MLVLGRLGPVVRDLGQAYRKAALWQCDGPTAPVIDDRERLAPVALAREQPVAQAVGPRRPAMPAASEPGDRAADRGFRLQPGESHPPAASAFAVARVCLRPGGSRRAGI